MTQYFYTIPVISVILLCMIFLTAANEFILPKHKKGFIVAFSGELFIIICEVLTIVLNGSAIEFKPIHFLANYLGFLLTPILIVFFAASIGRFHRVKGALIGIVTYSVLINCLIITKQLINSIAEIIGRHARNIVRYIQFSVSNFPRNSVLISIMVKTPTPYSE